MHTPNHNEIIAQINEIETYHCMSCRKWSDRSPVYDATKVCGSCPYYAALRSLGGKLSKFHAKRPVHLDMTRDEYDDLIARGMDVFDIALEKGVSETAVYNWRRAHGIDRCSRRKHFSIDPDKLVRLRIHASQRELAARLGISDRTLRHFESVNGLSERIKEARANA